MLRFSDKRNQAVNKKIGQIMMSEYNEGLQIKNQELGDNNNEDNEGIINTVKPVNNLKIKGRKGYSAKAKIGSTKELLKSSKDTLKDFISQSNILDSELNQMVSQFKLNNKGEFYGGDFSDDEDDEEEEDDNDEDVSEYYDKTFPEIFNKLLSVSQQISASDLKKFIKDKYNMSVPKSKFRTAFLDVKFPYWDTEEYTVTLSSARKQISKMEALLSELNHVKNGTTVITRSNNNIIDRVRSSKPGDQGHLLPTGTSQGLVASYLQKNDAKEKNGIRITNNIHVKKLSNELLLTIKKINNIVINLIPLAQNLSENHFAGAIHEDINKIKKMYADMDDKMYILTSLNDEATQLTKLDSDFETLLNAVNGGIASFVPMSGGSMVGDSLSLHPKSISVYKPNKHSVKTNHLYML